MWNCKYKSYQIEPCKKKRLPGEGGNAPDGALKVLEVAIPEKNNKQET